MAYLIPIVFIFALVDLFYTFSSFDHLVRAEYESARETWEADGRPRGFFWKAPEGSGFRSGWAKNRLIFVWLFTTPVWIAPSTMCRTWLNRFRICTLVWNVMMLFYFIWLVAVAR